MELDKLRYSVKELLRQKGWWYYTWRFLAVVWVIWMLWPDVEPRPVDKKPEAPQEQAFESKPWHQTSLVERDLRKIMTTAQSMYYWKHFNWVMEYAQPLQFQDFEGSTIKLLFVATEAKRSGEGTILCRSFREKLVIVEQANERVGVACRRGERDWCQQVRGEKLRCRSKGPGGLDALTSQAFDTHSFNLRMKEALNDLPSF